MGERNVQETSPKSQYDCSEVYLAGFHSYFSEEDFPPGSDFLLRDEKRRTCQRFQLAMPLSQSLKTRSPRPDYQTYRRHVERCGLYDGIMLDQFANHGTVGTRTRFGVPKEQMIQAILNIFRAVREQTRDDFLILINAGRSKPTRYAEYVNGSFMETGIR